MKDLTSDDLFEIFNNAKQKPVIILGAAASLPYLPIAKDLKVFCIKQIINNSHKTVSSNQKKSIFNNLNHSFFTLELMGSIFCYRLKDFDPNKMWENLNDCVEVNEISKALIKLREKSLIGPIITTNFDSMITDSFYSANVEYNFLTDLQLKDLSDMNVDDNDIVAIHGTVLWDPKGEKKFTPPGTLMARGLAKPFSPWMSLYLEKIFASERPIILIGYSGNDLYDLNPLIFNLNKNEKLIKENFFWISYHGSEKDFSKDVVSTFPDQLYSANPKELLIELCCKHCDIGKQYFDGDLKSKKDWRKIIEIFFKIKDNNDIIDRYTTILEDIINNIAAAWVILEHYYLYSVGFDRGIIWTFSGTKNDSEDLDSLNYFNINLNEVLDAHDLYWEENAKFKKLKQYQDNIVKNGFTKSFEKFDKIEQSAKDIILNYLNGNIKNDLINFRSEDHAILLVLRCISNDYKGLMYLQGVYKLEEYLKCNYSIELSEKCENYRKGAENYFSNCKKYANEAASILGIKDITKETEYDDLIQFRLWNIIGEENLARVAPLNERIKLLEKAINIREKEIESEENKIGGSEYLIAHYPQIWLRISELIKALLGIEGNTDIPTNNLNESDVEKANYQLKKCKKYYQKYKNECGLLNHRFVAVFDSDVVISLIGNNIEQANKSIEAARNELDTFIGGNREAAEKWIENVEKRVINYKKEHGLQSNV